MQSPDKWIRKYFDTTLSNMVVNNLSVPVYDYRAKNSAPNQYVLLSTQRKDENHNTKCYIGYECEILLDIVTIFQTTGNTGSRLLADDIESEILTRTNNISIENFTLISAKKTFPNDLVLTTDTEIIFRKFIRFNLKIK
mgnify:CR=1 FL=1